MNNFVFGATDPLLYNNIVPRGQEAIYMPENDVKRQLDSVMQQYQQLQSAKTESASKDWIGEFDKLLKSLDPEVANQLMENQEFVQLNALVQQDIQDEIMISIKWKLNGKQDTVNRVRRLMEIIDSHNKDKANEDKKNLAELTDYIQNYSDMTFNEYKQMKANKQ